MNNSISHSALRDYQKCPLLYFYRHHLKIQIPESSIHLVFGKALHYALEMHTKQKMNMVNTFKSAFKPDGLSYEDKLKFNDFMETGILQLKNYEGFLPGIQQMYGLTIMESEKRFELKNIVSPLSKTPLKFSQINGVIDFSTIYKKLGDYKTSSHKYTQAEVDESLQPTIYYLDYWMKNKELPKGFIYVVFLKKRKRDSIQMIETHRTLEDLENLVLLMNEIHTKVELKQFERSHDSSAFCDCYRYEEALTI